MSEQQVLSTGLEVLKLIVTGGIGGAICSCIGKWFFDKKLQEQKLEYDKQLESLRSELGKKITVHRLQFEKEFQLYGELWKALVDVRSTVIITPSLDKMPKDKPLYEVYKDRCKEAIDAFNKANGLFKYHRPFYHDDVSKITEELLGQCQTYIREVGLLFTYDAKFDDKLFGRADELSEKATSTSSRLLLAVTKVLPITSIGYICLIEGNRYEQKIYCSARS